MSKADKLWTNETKAAAGAGQFMRDLQGRVWFIHSKNDKSAISKRDAQGWTIVSPEVALAEAKAAQEPPVVEAPVVVTSALKTKPGKK
jgi:hypothetical protein